MTEIKDQELNRKLAEWAGITQEQMKEWIMACSGEKVSVEGLPSRIYPNFTQSLDACFKWLVPKLSSYKLDKANPKYHHAIAYLSTHQKSAWGETPAFALCLAIEKLIDGEENK